MFNYLLKLLVFNNHSNVLNLKATLVVKQNFFSELMIQGVESSLLSITFKDV